MYRLGHVTNNEEAKKLYNAYDIPYQEMKRSGEIRAKMSSRGYDFRKNVSAMLTQGGAGVLLDHIDICEDSQGRFVFIASPYDCGVTPQLQEFAEARGYEITESEFTPYAGVRAIIVRNIG